MYIVFILYRRSLTRQLVNLETQSSLAQTNYYIMLMMTTSYILFFAFIE